MAKRLLTDIELSYMAGLFDGEGCIRVIKHATNHSAYNLQVVIGITYVHSLEILRDTFGGSIIIRRKEKSHYKQLYSWTIYGRDAHNFLISVLPYLQEKKEQAILAEEYYKKFGHSTNGKSRYASERAEQEWYYRKLQELKKVEYVPGSNDKKVTTKSSDIHPEQLRLVE